MRTLQVKPLREQISIVPQEPLLFSTSIRDNIAYGKLYARDDLIVAAARQAGVKINTIAFGTQNGELALGGRTILVPSDPPAMAQIASDTGGRTFTAQSAGQLKSVYSQIGRVVGYDVHRHEITAWFTGIALAFAIAAAVTALIWTQRIV